VVPEVVGNVTALALKAAFSGDEGAVEAIERKADRLEKEIERDVERRADELGRRADKLCPQLTELDRLESTLGRAPGRRPPAEPARHEALSEQRR
jgi:hypothetical protein